MLHNVLEAISHSHRVPTSLVVGAPNGRVRDFFKRLSVIHKKNGPFDLILCNGDLFAQDEDDALISALLDDQIEGMSLSSHLLPPQNMNEH
jgi:hypothetical protein